MVHRTGARRGRRFALTALTLLALAMPACAAPGAYAAVPRAPAPSSAPGATAPATTGTDDVYRGLGVDRVPAAYAVLIDVSTSMNTAVSGGGTRYTTLVSRLRTFLRSLPGGDRVAVITFGQSVNTVQTMGPIGSVDGLIANLPPKATENETDFGTALATAAGQLEASDAPARSVLLLSDGTLRAPGTPYATLHSAGWSGLRTRYAELAGNTTLTGFGLPLAGHTDLSGVLGRVFTTPRILPYRPAQLDAQLDEAKDQVRAGKAASVLKPDDGAGVSVTWSTPAVPASSHAVVPVGDATGDHREAATVTLRSRTTHVPLTVSGLTVTGGPGGTPVRVTGLPASAHLVPGLPQSFQVMLSWHTDRTSTLTGGSADWQETLRLTGTVSSPWTTAIRGPIGDPSFRPGGLTPSTLRLRGTVGHTVLVWPWIVLTLLLLAGLGAWYTLYTRRNPRLSGRLAVSNLRSGSREYIALKGRKVTAEFTVEDISARLVVRAVRAERGSGGDRHLLRLECERRTPPSSDVNTCPPDGRTIVCGIAVKHESIRTVPAREEYP